MSAVEEARVLLEERLTELQRERDRVANALAALDSRPRRRRRRRKPVAAEPSAE